MPAIKGPQHNYVMTIIKVPKMDCVSFTGEIHKKLLDLSSSQHKETGNGLGRGARGGRAFSPTNIPFQRRPVSRGQKVT